MGVENAHDLRFYTCEQLPIRVHVNFAVNRGNGENFAGSHQQLRNLATVGLCNVQTAELNPRSRRE